MVSSRFLPYEFRTAYSSDKIDTSKGSNVILALQKRVAHYLGYSTNPDLTEDEMEERIKSMKAVTPRWKINLRI